MGFFSATTNIRVADHSDWPGHVTFTHVDDDSLYVTVEARWEGPGLPEQVVHRSRVRKDAFLEAVTTVTEFHADHTPEPGFQVSVSDEQDHGDEKLRYLVFYANADMPKCMWLAGFNRTDESETFRFQLPRVKLMEAARVVTSALPTKYLGWRSVG